MTPKQRAKIVKRFELMIQEVLAEETAQDRIELGDHTVDRLLKEALTNFINAI